jgi:signal transduction histidine kinase
VTQQSVFGFLSETGLPLVSSVVSFVRWLALALAGAGLGYGVFALAWWDGGLWNAALPWAGALPALVASPGFLLAWWLARRERMQAAVLALFSAICAMAALATWPRGVFCTTWYLQPILALISCCCLGPVPGLLLTLVVIASVLAAPIATTVATTRPGELQLVWTHTASLALLTLASALAGLLVHALLRRALMAAEGQRRLNQDARRALRHRERLLRHAMRVETVGDLAGLVTHQLRNSFQVMMGHAALGAASDDAECARRLALVSEELANSRILLDQLMSLAHPDEGEPAAADVDAEVRAFHLHAELIMPASIRLVFESCGRDLPVLVNPRGLEHALWNLVINARQAMPEGGTITLRTILMADQALIEVADTGSGIPPAIRPRVFDPYFTTKPPGQGTGLGLAAVDRFVRASNGSIALDSEVGRGTCFRLVFPLLRASAVRTA